MCFWALYPSAFQWHLIFSATVLRIENSAFHLQVLDLPEESIIDGHSPHEESGAIGKGQAIHRPTADVSNTSLKFQPLPVEVLNCGGEISLDWCT